MANNNNEVKEINRLIVQTTNNLTKQSKALQLINKRYADVGKEVEKTNKGIRENIKLTQLETEWIDKRIDKHNELYRVLKNSNSSVSSGGNTSTVGSGNNGNTVVGGVPKESNSKTKVTTKGRTQRTTTRTTGSYGETPKSAENAIKSLGGVVSKLSVGLFKFDEINNMEVGLPDIFKTVRSIDRRLKDKDKPKPKPVPPKTGTPTKTPVSTPTSVGTPVGTLVPVAIPTAITKLIRETTKLKNPVGNPVKTPVSQGVGVKEKEKVKETVGKGVTGGEGVNIPLIIPGIVAGLLGAGILGKLMSKVGVNKTKGKEVKPPYWEYYLPPPKESKMPVKTPVKKQPTIKSLPTPTINTIGTSNMRNGKPIIEAKADVVSSKKVKEPIFTMYNRGKMFKDRPVKEPSYTIYSQGRKKKEREYVNRTMYSTAPDVSTPSKGMGKLGKAGIVAGGLAVAGTLLDSSVIDKAKQSLRSITIPDSVKSLLGVINGSNVFQGIKTVLDIKIPESVPAPIRFLLGDSVGEVLLTAGLSLVPFGTLGKWLVGAITVGASAIGVDIAMDFIGKWADKGLTLLTTGGTITKDWVVNTGFKGIEVLTNTLDKARTSASEIFDNVLNKVTSAGEQIRNWFSNITLPSIITNPIDTLSSGVSNVGKKVSSGVNSALDTFNNFVGIPKYAEGGLHVKPHLGIVGDVKEATIPLNSSKANVAYESIGKSVANTIGVDGNRGNEGNQVTINVGTLIGDDRSIKMLADKVQGVINVNNNIMGLQSQGVRF